MGNKARARKKKAAARYAEHRAARKCAEEREGYAALIAARQAHRRAALVVATAFVNQHMPRPERMGAFCNAMKDDLVIHFSEKENTTKIYEALWWMSYNCRFCGEGKWYCKCQRVPDGPDGDEEVSEDGSWLSDGPEWESGWETDTEDEEQNEGLSTPAERHNLKPSISPDDVTVTAKTAKRALLFAEGK